jgi:uncharacterized protein (DUF305 family)
MDHSTHSDNKNTVSDPCNDVLTDLEYLEHMIPHHQVAIDMSDLLVPNTSNPIILHLCRDITRKQGYEIWEMNMMLESLPDNISSNSMGVIEDVITKLDIYDPIMSKSKEGGCNPLFFKPNDHSAHMAGMEITDTSYLEHMIPHHQVAIDMSKRLLLHTNSNYLIDFCRKLILDQQGEIFYMNSLLLNKSNYKSLLL